jgi:hypothetical protein
MCRRPLVSSSSRSSKKSSKKYGVDYFKEINKKKIHMFRFYHPRYFTIKIRPAPLLFLTTDDDVHIKLHINQLSNYSITAIKDKDEATSR